MTGPDSDHFPDFSDPLIEEVDEELFSNSIGSLNSHIRQKNALAHPIRYAILYTVWEHGEIEHPDLVAQTDIPEDDLDHQLKPLLNTNLIARVPSPESHSESLTYYRITTMGRQEIESDRQNILGETE